MTVALAVVLAAAFGGGVIAAAGGEGQAITTPEAVAWIRAVNFTPSDLPGSTPFIGEAGSPLEGVGVQRLLHCGHRGPPRGRAVATGSSVLADRYGDWIGEVVGSAMIVMPNESVAKAEIAEFRSRYGRTCVTNGFRTSYPAAAGSNRPRYTISINSVPVAGLLGREALDLHLLATLKRLPRVRQNRRDPTTRPARLVYSVESVFRVGAADILFYTLSEHRSFPLSIEQRLLTVLHSRATAHKL